MNPHKLFPSDPSFVGIVWPPIQLINQPLYECHVARRASSWRTSQRAYLMRLVFNPYPYPKQEEEKSSLNHKTKTKNKQQR